MDKGVPRILLVEDNPDHALITMHFLRKKWTKSLVEHVMSVEDAIAVTDSWLFDCIVLDFNLPDGSGESVLAHLRSFDGETPVVVFSALIPDDAARRMMAAGASAIVRKEPDAYAALPDFLEEMMAREGGDFSEGESATRCSPTAARK